MDELKNRPHTAGLKTTLRAIAAGQALKVFIAEDADVFVRRRVQETASENGVSYEYVPSMKELGDICDLQVKTACAALIKQ